MEFIEPCKDGLTVYTKSDCCKGKPAGQPSITIPTHAPCDSPKICTLNKVPKLFILLFLLQVKHIIYSI